MSSKGKKSGMEEGGKPALVPKLRFPDFRGAEEWTQHRLGEICNLYQPEMISSSDFVSDGKHLVYGANGVIGRFDRYNHEFEEVAISCRGNCGEVHFTLPRSWITGNAMIVSPEVGNLSKAFLYRLLVAADLKPVISGSAQPQITRQGLSPFLVAFPSSSEQQKIAECLTSLDELITAQARKVDALKKHKKGLMQDLFPREGQTQPRRRFPEFQNAGKWEVRSIGQLGEVVTGSTPSTARMDYYGGDRMFVSPADISDGRFIEKTKTTLTNIGFVETRPIRANSVLFVCIGSTIGKIAQNRHECATNQQINSIVPYPSYADGFIYYALSRMAGEIADLAGIQAVPIINKSLFSAVELLVAKPHEQRRIADCLTSLDECIAAATGKLDTLNRHKRGLMQQLFPSAEVAL